jgi:hypothetical protein
LTESKALGKKPKPHKPQFVTIDVKHNKSILDNMRHYRQALLEAAYILEHCNKHLDFDEPEEFCQRLAKRLRKSAGVEE